MLDREGCSGWTRGGGPAGGDVDVPAASSGGLDDAPGGVVAFGEGEEERRTEFDDAEVGAGGLGRGEVEGEGGGAERVDQEGLWK